MWIGSRRQYKGAYANTALSHAIESNEVAVAANPLALEGTRAGRSLPKCLDVLHADRIATARLHW